VNTSTSQRRQSVLLAGTVGVLIASVSCSQPPSNGAAPTAPSPLSAGATSTAVQPGPAYDATGRWFGEYARWKNGPVVGEGYVNLVQDADGHITGTGDPPEEDCHTYAFTRVGDGAPTIRYRVDISPSGEQCQGHLKGLAELDIDANVIEAHLTGAAEDGSRLNVSLTLTKQ